MPETWLVWPPWCFLVDSEVQTEQGHVRPPGQCDGELLMLSSGLLAWLLSRECDRISAGMYIFDSPQVCELTEDSPDRRGLAGVSGRVPLPSRAASRPRGEGSRLAAGLCRPPPFVLVPSCCLYFSSATESSLVAMPTPVFGECEVSLWLF